MSRLRGLALSALLALGAAPTLPAQTPTHLGVPQFRMFTMQFYRSAIDPVGGSQYSGLKIWDSAGHPMTFPASGMAMVITDIRAGHPMTFPASGMAMVITDIRVGHQGLPFTNGVWEISDMNQNTSVIHNLRWQIYLPKTDQSGVHHAPMTSGLVFGYPMKPVLGTNMEQPEVVNLVTAYGSFVPVK
jgi:hypothetical protein